MTKFNQNLKRIHFLILAFIVLNFVIQILTNYGINSVSIFALKIIIYISGFILFFLNRKAISKIKYYFSYYLISFTIIILFRFFGGIFLGLISSIILFPINPRKIQYENGNLKIYEKFNGFLGACCEYEIIENKLIFFEKKYGKIKLEEPINKEIDSFSLLQNAVKYKHKKTDYNFKNERTDIIITELILIQK